MKPAAFDYVRAETVEHALDALSQAGGDAKIIAGGQSLMPMMNFRLVKPSVLVDINAIPDLDSIGLEASRLRIGALVRHFMTAQDPVIAREAPIVTEAMKHVAHLTVRNRGTFCGSVCHADPAAEMPMMTVLLDGRMHVRSLREVRTVSVADFFVGGLMTSLKPDELVTAIDLEPMREGTGFGFHEFARRHGDYALAAVAVLLRRDGDGASDVRIAVMGVGEMPARLPAAEAALQEGAFSEASVQRAVEALRAEISPNSDLNASSDYRRHLAGALAGRAIRDAWSSAGQMRTL
jgi:CO/xanthine dehydrogenase FAD-binding subunit